MQRRESELPQSESESLRQKFCSKQRTEILKYGKVSCRSNNMRTPTTTTSLQECIRIFTSSMRKKKKEGTKDTRTGKKKQKSLQMK